MKRGSLYSKKSNLFDMRMSSVISVKEKIFSRFEIKSVSSFSVLKRIWILTFHIVGSSGIDELDTCVKTESSYDF